MLVTALEGGPTKHKHVKADSQGPDICNAGLIASATTHLWGHEGWGPSCSVNKVSNPCQLGAAEVGDLDVSIGGQQEVVRLQVTMGNLVCMQVAQTL